MRTEEAFFQRRREDWHRLDHLSTKAERGMNRLSGAELTELVRLYRKASSDLSRLIAEGRNPELIEWLNGLVGRAYGILYKTPRRPLGKVLADGALAGARTFRKRIGYTLVSSAIFFVSVLAVFLIVGARPEMRDYFMPPGFEGVVDHWTSGVHPPKDAEGSIMASSFYAVNNPTVALRMVSLNVITFGFFGVYMLYMTGAMLGALSFETLQAGTLDFLLISIMPHGISEIGGILITGGAGFMLAMALINPGRRTRAEAMREAGKDAFTLWILSLVMIFAAAPIEGFFSFNPAVPEWSKVVFAIIAFGAWGAYLWGYGRSGDEVTPPASQTDA